MEDKQSKYEVLSAVANGDVRAFHTLFDTYRDKLYYFLLRIVETRESAEDLVQDIFLKVWLNREDLHTIRNFNAYLYQMARNTAINGLRRKALEAVILEGNPVMLADISSETQLLLKDLRRQLQKAVDRLPPQQKKVYTLRRSEHYSVEEIADHLRISPLTVKRHLTEALKSIRQELRVSYKDTIGLVIILLLTAP